MVDEIVRLLAGLGGLGTLITVLVNLLKIVGIVHDGTSERWVQGFNLAAFIAVSVVYFLNIQVDWVTVDGVLLLLATAFGFIVQMVGSRIAYTAVRGIPWIGYSHSEK